MAKTRTETIAALDVGSSKVTCFIGRTDAEGAIRVVGIGHHASKGVRWGAIIDMEAAQASILAAVSAAEEMAGEQRIQAVIVNASGGHPASQSIGVQVSIAGHEIRESDLRRVLSEGYTHQQPPDKELIHCIPVGYSIDGSRGIRDPGGMFGDRLGVNMHMVTADAGPMRNLATCVARCHLDIEGLVVAPYASGLGCLVEDEIDLGVTLIDMGGGTTTIAVFYDGQCIHTDSIGVGGNNVTTDIARGLTTPLAHAERMKTLYGNAVASPADEREIIDVPLMGEDFHTQPHHVPRSMLVGIIQPRLEETFELVRARLEASGADKVAGRRLVLTGGASQLNGVRELAALILEKQVRIGRPIRIGGLAEATGGPAFATCAGLLIYAATSQDDARETMRAISAGPLNRIGRLGLWLRENF